MRPVKEETLDVLEEAAREGGKQILAYFAYQGDNKKYHDKAKVGAVAIAGFAKTRQSETGRMQTEIVAQRMSTASETKRLKS